MLRRRTLIRVAAGILVVGLPAGRPGRRPVGTPAPPPKVRAPAVARRTISSR